MSLARPAPVLPDHIAQTVWRGNALGGQMAPVLSSGHAVLDAELPGGGWPCQSLTEVLQAPGVHAEWRLLSPGLARLVAQGGSVLLVNPPHGPHLPALLREGLREDRLVWIHTRTPLDALWATEQALKARSVSAVLAWLPQARSDQLRRLQACAMQHPALAFVFRRLASRNDASAAPLRIEVSVSGHPPKLPPPLRVNILKRRGPLLDRIIEVPHWPLGLAPLIQRSVPVSACDPW
jgi:protein ImuA